MAADNVGTTGLAVDLAHWASALDPTAADLALADRALLDTVAVTVAARHEPIAAVVAGRPDALRWSALAHALDFDDLHLLSTAHLSAICVPTALATGGGARAYLAGAGVMARLGSALGWAHYQAGWHATCTAGAPAAAVVAATAWGFDVEQTARAMALAVPAAGGVQRAFGTIAKPLQVGFAAQAGVRAAELVRDGATADPAAIDDWFRLVGGQRPVDLSGSAVPDGLATKVFPCCYALQRPLAAMAELEPVDAAGVEQIVVRTPGAALQPLVHHRPQTGLAAKFSLEYAVVAALLDRPVGLASFTDAAVLRPPAQQLLTIVDVEPTVGGAGLLDGSCRVELRTGTGTQTAELKAPPGAPEQPVTTAQIDSKASECCAELAAEVLATTWTTAAALLHHVLP